MNTRNVIRQPSNTETNLPVISRHYTVNGTPEKLPLNILPINGNERNGNYFRINSVCGPISNNTIVSLSQKNQRILERTMTKEVITTTERIVESSTSMVSFEDKSIS